MDRPRTEAISWLGRVGDVEPPTLVRPLTVQPTEPRICQDVRFLKLCMKPFTLDTLNDLPRYAAKNSYQTVLDDKSGYYHILLSEDSRTFSGIKWETGTLPTQHITFRVENNAFRLSFSRSHDHHFLSIDWNSLSSFQ